MTNDKMIQFVKRWREIERQQKDIDFARSRLAGDIRAEFDKGERGDVQFTNWCVNELGLTAWGARELLTRAIAVTVVPDERTWKMVGGFRAIRPMQELSRKDQISVLETAKSQARAPINIMKERGLIKAPEPKPEPRPAPNLFPVKPKYEHDPYLDAVALAQYIAKTNRQIPRDILTIINRYQSFMRKVA